MKYEPDRAMGIEDLLQSKPDRAMGGEDMLQSKPDRAMEREDMLKSKPDRAMGREDMLQSKPDKAMGREDLLQFSYLGWTDRLITVDHPQRESELEKNEYILLCARFQTNAHINY